MEEKEGENICEGYLCRDGKSGNIFWFHKE